VLTDANPKYRPCEYAKNVFGCELYFRFPIVKVLDYAAKWDALENSSNPFSVVVMAHLKAQETAKGGETERKKWKLYLARMLYERGYDKKDILELFRFIDWLMILPDDLEKRFWEELVNIEEEKKMPYVTSVERIGIEKGIQQGVRQGAKMLIKRLLIRRFGEIPLWAEKHLEAADTAKMEIWADRILDANSPEEVFS